MTSTRWSGRGIVAALVAVTLVLAQGCSKASSNDGKDARAAVSGRLVGPTGTPISAAAVSAEGGAVGTTAADGLFAIRLAAGSHRLTFSVDGQLLADLCLAVAELTTYELGDVSSYTPSNCAAVVGGEGDADGDGLPEADEVTGWVVVVVDGDGVVQARKATSDPAVADSDGDGLSDAEERAAGTDPRRKDTDGDLLSDFAELTVFKSDPRSVDTDGDSRGPAGLAPTDPNLWDGNELLRSQTSPTLADTDGDGMTDWEEIHSGGTNPLVADLPTLSLEVYGDPRISLDVESVQGCESSSVDLARATTEQVDTDLVSTRMSIENTVALHTEAEIGTSNWPPSANAKLTTDTEFKQAWMHETSSSWTATSSTEAEQRAACWEKQLVNFAGGNIGTTMKLRNRSDLAFNVKELGIIAYQLRGGGRFSLIGTMNPVAWREGGYTLGPSGELILEVSKTDLGAEVMKALVKTPSALLFEVGGYSLFQLDETGTVETVNYAKLGESVVQRTGLLVIDDGVRAPERYMVATNVYRNPDGSGRGVALKDALATLGIDYASDFQRDDAGAVVGPRTLTRVRGVAAYRDGKPGRGFWMVAGNGAAFEPGAAPSDFDDVVLESGERVSLVYMQDTDLDGVFDREEALLGTDEALADTDGDQLSDYEETKVGWGVEAAGVSYQVYSDPRQADYDGDYLSDGTERGLRTNPYLVDTDGDGTPDTNDPDPLNPPCLGGGATGLAAWWNGTASGATVLDTWVATSPGQPAVASNGTLVGGASVITVAGGNVFNLNPLVSDTGQYVEVANSVSPAVSRELSISVLVYRNNLATFPDWATVASKGAYGAEQYALYLAPNGQVAFTLLRSEHRKCWYCWFNSACDDGSCADDDYQERSVLVTAAPAVAPLEWTLLTATFGGEWMRLYRNGQKVAELQTYAWWPDGFYRYETTTNYLVGNATPLRIGVSAPGSRPFSGMLDDVQVYGVALTAGQVLLLDSLGTCAP